MFRKIRERSSILWRNKTKFFIYITICIAIFLGFTVVPFRIWLGTDIETKGFTSVRGDSMSPTVNNNDILYIDQLTFERGEIVCVRCSTENIANLSLLKRIVGLPGETVEMTSEGVLINGVLLEEDYISDQSMTFQENNEYNEVILSDDEYFVLGDNREESFDSRDVGAVHKRDFLYALTIEPNGYTMTMNIIMIILCVGCFLCILSLPIAVLFIMTNADAPKTPKLDKKTGRLTANNYTISNMIVEKSYKKQKNGSGKTKMGSKKKKKKK